MQIKKKSIMLLLLVMTMTWSYGQNSAYVYQDSLYRQLKGYKVKIAAADSLTKMYSDEIKAEREKLTQKFNQLSSPYNVKQNESVEMLKGRMSALDVEKLNILVEEEKALNNKYTSYNALLEKQYKQDIQPYVDKVNAAIEEYAALNKLDYVWIADRLKPALAYINRGKDITSTIVGIVSKKIP